MKNFWVIAFCFAFAAGISSCSGNKDGSTETPAGGNETPASNTANENGEVKEVPPGDQPSNLPPTTISFNAMTHDFGKIKEGEIVSHKFMFKNTGDKPLKIEGVKPSCGCTTPDYTKDEVKPGDEGFVAVEFNSAGKEGQQTKTVNVTANTPERNITLTFTGEVIKEK